MSRITQHHTDSSLTSPIKVPFYQRIKQGINLSLLLLATTFIAACSDEDKTVSNSPSTEKSVIKIGTSPGDFGDLVRGYLGPELQKAGYKVELSEITDIVIPNLSVEEGSLDLNIFQHKPYMEDFNKNQQGHLVPFIQVPTAPYGLYSGKLKSLDAVKQGATVGIPSNVTNFSRGLLILESIGWIKLREGITDRFRIEKTDIIDNPYNLNIKEIEAAQMVRVRPDLDYAIINGNFALDAGIHFKEALAIEPSKHFINWVVTHEKNLNTPWIQEIITILSSEGFKEYSATRFANYNYPLAWEQ